MADVLIRPEFVYLSIEGDSVHATLSLLPAVSLGVGFLYDHDSGEYQHSLELFIGDALPISRLKLAAFPASRSALTLILLVLLHAQLLLVDYL